MSPRIGQRLASVQSAIGTTIAYSTQPDNVALDGVGWNSPFTAALLKHIATPNVEIGTIMRRVRADVVAATHERQGPLGFFIPDWRGHSREVSCRSARLEGAEAE
jgi:hypothetical protein